MKPDVSLPASSEDALLRQHAVVVAVLAAGLCALVLLEGPRAPAMFWRVLLPVLALSLAGVLGAAALVPQAWTARAWAYPAACTLGGAAGSVLGLGTSAMLRHHSTLAVMLGQPVGWHSIGGGIVLGALFGITLWWLGHLRERDREQQRRLFDLQAEALRSQAGAAEADAERARIALQLLQAQVEPHFLYNALANLRYLVRRDADLAQHLIDQLIRYFRAALPSLRQAEVSLAHELELCEAFAAIQSVRVDGRLVFEIDVAPDLRSARLPPAMLLTLLENAFKHAEPEDGSTPRVTISARREGANLLLRVTDNGPGLRPAAPQPGDGHGLQWLVQRLRAVHGDRSRFDMLSIPDGGCRAQLTLPLEPGDLR
jgi:signal transduction histidine kinase